MVSISSLSNHKVICQCVLHAYTLYRLLVHLYFHFEGPEQSGDPARSDVHWTSRLSEQCPHQHILVVRAASW